MLGVYEQFPINVHKITAFAVSVSNKKFQQKLIQTLRNVNNKTFSLEEITAPSLPQCTVVFEYGIAEANSFNYLDEEEASKALKAVNKKSFQVMDFFCAIRYYKKLKERKISLKFDYYMTRLTFNEKLMEIQVFHEKGPRYISPEELVNFIVTKINEVFSKKVLKELKLV